MTDSGYFGADGTVKMLLPKSMTIPDLPIAVAAVGAFHLGYLAKELNAGRHTFVDVEDFLRRVGGILRAAYRAEGCDPRQAGVRLAIVLYSERARRAAGCTLFTPGMGPEDKEPWRPYPVSTLLQPNVGAGCMPAADFRDAAAFDPSRDTGRLIDAQRAHRAWDGELEGHCGLAGDVELACVSAAGVTVTTLRSYPDRVGEHAGKHDAIPAAIRPARLTGAVAA
jgi:hypothetical protein